MSNQAERWEVNGKETTEAKGRGALAGDDQVPDDSKVPSLTLIGSKEVTSKLRKDLMGSAELSALVGKFLVQEFEPTNPLIARSGFLAAGTPTIYAEMPDGRTLFRLDEYPGDQAFIRTVHRALQVAEGVRKPQPDYAPASDPGIVLPIKPKIDAEVSPAPGTLIMSHLAAFVSGILGTLGIGGGGYVLLRKVLAGLVAAELGKVTPPATSPATPQK
jgi:hypothetical protein